MVQKPRLCIIPSYKDLYPWAVIYCVQLICDATIPFYKKITYVFFLCYLKIATIKVRQLSQLFLFAFLMLFL